MIAGSVDEAARQRDALLLAARQFAREAPAEVRQLHHPSAAAARSWDFRRRPTAHLQREADILPTVRCGNNA